MRNICVLSAIIYILLSVFICGVAFSADPVNEKSTSKFTMTFYDEDGVLVTPTSGTYKIVDIKSGTVIKDTTAFTPTGSTHSITITDTENRILDQNKAYEQRRITVTISYGTSKSSKGEFLYSIKNLIDIN